LMHIQACFFELPKLLNYFNYLHISFFELWKLSNASSSLHASKSKLANLTNPSNYIHVSKTRLPKLFNLSTYASRTCTLLKPSCLLQPLSHTKKCFYHKTTQIFILVHFNWRTPKLLDRLKCESEVKTTEE
jgi:hypothetical protein